MDQKKNTQRKTKRQSKAALEENFWDCSVCTYRNTAEAFKCAMCDVRKGTSTRKPRLNPQLIVAQQVAHQTTTPKPKREGSKERKSQNSSSGNFEERKSKKKIRNIRPRLKNVDRSQGVHRQPVTVNNVTVVITEFLPKTVASTIQNPVISMDSVDVPSSSDVSNHSEISVNGDVAPGSSSS